MRPIPRPAAEPAAEQADHLGLLALRVAEPQDRQRDEEEAPAAEQVVVTRAGRAGHWITSSAFSRIDCGIVRPSALALFRLITSSNFVGC